MAVLMANSSSVRSDTDVCIQVEIARHLMPRDMPLFFRISATDWLEDAPQDQIPESWTSKDTVKLAPILGTCNNYNPPLKHYDTARCQSQTLVLTRNQPRRV
jgi:hypothetical protein